MSEQPQCERCGKRSGVRLAYRLDPVNWHPTHKRLCGPCRTTLGYRAVTYGRTNLDYEMVR